MYVSATPPIGPPTPLSYIALHNPTEDDLKDYLQFGAIPPAIKKEIVELQRAHNWDSYKHLGDRANEYEKHATQQSDGVLQAIFYGIAKTFLQEAIKENFGELEKQENLEKIAFQESQACEKVAQGKTAHERLDWLLRGALILYDPQNNHMMVSIENFLQAAKLWTRLGEELSRQVSSFNEGERCFANAAQVLKEASKWISPERKVMFNEKIVELQERVFLAQLKGGGKSLVGERKDIVYKNRLNLAEQYVEVFKKDKQLLYLIRIIVNMKLAAELAPTRANSLEIITVAKTLLSKLQEIDPSNENIAPLEHEMSQLISKSSQANKN